MKPLILNRRLAALKAQVIDHYDPKALRPRRKEDS